MQYDKIKSKAYLVGGGIASLACAVFLIRDGHFYGKNIYILEQSENIGGSLDAMESPSDDAFMMRGFRMFEEKVYSAMYDLFSSIPSLVNSKKTLNDDFQDFNNEVKTCAKARLIENGNVIKKKTLGLKLKDRFLLLKFLVCPESFFEGLRVDEYFSPAFFKSNFYYNFGTTFAFQPWSSVVEFRRYILRFLHDCPLIATGECIRSSRYNQNDSIIVPIVEWLKNKGVNFTTEARVVDLDFLNEKQKTVSFIRYVQDGKKKKIIVNKEDFVFVTLGSMTADSSFGSMNKAPVKPKRALEAWELWKNISKKFDDFGKPSVFCEDLEKSSLVSFTITHRDPMFFDLMEKCTGNSPGTGGLVTFKNSNWLITISIPYQPYFLDQPADIAVSWGYGLFPNKKGNFIKKKMIECSGKEILTEVLNHLKFNSQMGKIIKNSICIPCLMPYCTSQFLPRKKHDRPCVVPFKSSNLALVGQYSEIPKDMVFTMEYSIRSAQIAVYTLLDLDKEITPLYDGLKRYKVVLNAVKTAFR